MFELATQVLKSFFNLQHSASMLSTFNKKN